jgi:hypothetical protein
VQTPAPGKGQTVAIHWTATDPQQEKLTASIDYSRDSGHSWRTIFVGPSTGEATLPSFYLAHSSTAEIRVRVGDGFDETDAASKVFKAPGAKPTVAILTPAANAQLTEDTTVSLTGQAFDDTLAPLAGKALTWSVNGTAVGHGGAITVTGLAPGADKITLTAADAEKRRASATVTVHVARVRPRFLELRVPSKVSSKATQLQILAGSAIPAKLTVAGKTVSLGTRLKAIVIAIQASSSAVTVHLKVAALGATYHFTYVVGRTVSLPNPPHPPPCGLQCV